MIHSIYWPNKLKYSSTNDSPSSLKLDSMSSPEGSGVGSGSGDGDGVGSTQVNMGALFLGASRGGLLGSGTCFKGWCLGLSIGPKLSSISGEMSSSTPFSGSNGSSSFWLWSFKSSATCSTWVTEISIKKN